MKAAPAGTLHGRRSPAGLFGCESVGAPGGRPPDTLIGRHPGPELTVAGAMLQWPRTRSFSVDGLMRAADVRTDNPAAAAYERRVRWLAAAGGLLALSGVAARAFGAHALKTWLPPDPMSAFETAARYQVTHALALLACAWVLQSWPGRAPLAAGVCFVAGAVLFCGSLYGFRMTGTGSPRLLTPLGRIGFLAGRILVFRATVQPR